MIQSVLHGSPSEPPAKILARGSTSSVGVESMWTYLVGGADGVASCSFAGLLLLVAVLKVRDRQGITAVLAGYGAIPAPLAAPLAVLLPVAEFVLGIGIVFPGVHRLASVALAAFFAGTALVVGASLAMRQVPATCGCFGVEPTRPPSWRLVWRNALMAGIATAIALLGRNTVDWGYTAAMFIVVVPPVVALMLGGRLASVWWLARDAGGNGPAGRLRQSALRPSQAANRWEGSAMGAGMEE